MGAFLFGGGPGHLPAKAKTIAAKYDAALVNYTDPECNCGRGHKPFTCPKSRRHWFTTPNLGPPFDGSTAKAVLDDLRAAGLIE